MSFLPLFSIDFFSQSCPRFTFYYIFNSHFWAQSNIIGEVIHTTDFVCVYEVGEEQDVVPRKESWVH